MYICQVMTLYVGKCRTFENAVE